MAERVMDGFQRILGMTTGFRLAETDVGQFALEQFGESVVLRGRLTAAIGEVGKARVLPFEMVQDILKALLDPSEISGAMVGGSFQPFEQIGYALLQMSEGRRAVVADRHAVEAIGQGQQGALDLLGILARRRPLLAALE